MGGNDYNRSGEMSSVANCTGDKTSQSEKKKGYLGPQVKKKQAQVLTLDHIIGIFKESLLHDGQTAARTQAEQACSSKLHTKISLSNSIGSLLIGLR